MALIVPYQSRQGIAVGNAGQVAPYQKASAFVTPGQAAMPGALREFAAGMDKPGSAVFDVALERQRMQNATDMLADKIEYRKCPAGF